MRTGRRQGGRRAQVKSHAKCKLARWTRAASPVHSLRLGYSRSVRFVFDRAAPRTDGRCGVPIRVRSTFIPRVRARHIEARLILGRRSCINQCRLSGLGRVSLCSARNNIALFAYGTRCLLKYRTADRHVAENGEIAHY